MSSHSSGSKRLGVLANQTSANVPIVPHFIGGKLVVPENGSSPFAYVRNPATGEAIGRVCEASSSEVASALASAEAAYASWSSTPVKQRATVLFAFRQLLLEHQSWFVKTITLEHGKHETDALASFAKGLETLDYALGLPAVIAGRTLEVSSGVTCQDRRQPVGIVLSIVPFNFPVMVPMWTLPIALMLGNVVVMKPSEKVPSCLLKMGELLKTAGLVDGAFTVLQGGSTLVNSLVADHRLAAVTFVGSTPVAKIVYDMANAKNVRALCLGGAKNHLVAQPDCDLEMAAGDIVASFAGSSGQRCMAASVLLVVDASGTPASLASHPLVRRVVEKARELHPGQTGPGKLGPVIDDAAVKRISKYINNSEQNFRATVLLDGRGWSNGRPGHWVGPTVLLHEDASSDPALTEEIFGPVLSVLRVSSLDEAVRRINAHPYGNAACVYTSHGGVAEIFTKAVNVGMVGVNIGVPVPREPFSFGGSKQSKFGISDITGDGLVEFLTRRVKVTTKWAAASKKAHGGNDVVAEAFVR